MSSPPTLPPDEASPTVAPAINDPAINDPALADPAPADPDAAELARLRAEVSALRRTADARRRRAVTVTSLRRVTAAVLVALAAFGMVASVVGVWASTTALNTDRWVATVAPLPKNPQVAAAVADYATTEVFRVVDVDQRLKAVLPDQAAFVAGPIAGQLRDYTRRTVDTVLRSDRFQPIWIEANRRAHQQAMAILEGRSQVIATAGDHVDIDLLPLVNEVLRLISAQLPTLFGHQLSLPDISSGEIPANLRTVVQNQLGVQLPANFAQFAVYDGGQLAAAQQALVEARRGVALLVVTTVVLLGLALAVSPARRRTLLQLGLWLVVAAIAVTASLRAVRAQLVAQVPEGTYRSGVESAVTIVTATLRERGVQIIWVGALLALVAYLVGPGRVPVWLRRQAAAVARTIGGAVRRAARFAVRRGPGWIVGHLDVLRIAGLVVAGVAALVLSSWSSLLVVILVLAGYEVAVTVIARTTASPVDGVASPVAGAAGPAAS